ncbi:hypothetical protein Sjap_008155 [Stephania japonica]|uniref:Methyltransferase n=1 Tax=Stephania japonica TaxID=461633 RepID=A0AAP0PE72_9MAGN
MISKAIFDFGNGFAKVKRCNVGLNPCITPLPKVKSIKDTSGGAMEKWPKRVSHYAKFRSFHDGKYRNIMDMIAGFGGFAAALSKYPVWVINVVPFGGFAAALPKE